MATRTTVTTVIFRRPFSFDGVGRKFPAGSYSVETDEEILEGMYFTAYRRVLTLFHVRETAEHPGIAQTLTIDPNALAEAVKRDRAPDGYPDDNEDIPVLPRPGYQGADWLSLDRAEDEGMVRHRP